MMAINDFISTVWSETLHKELDKEYIAVRNCNRDFEGSIRRAGDTVNICGIEDIHVFSYTKNSDISALQTLDSTKTQLRIDQVEGFNFQIDDVDRAQQNPKLMQHAMSRAASALANSADRYVYGLYTGISAANTVSKASAVYTDMLDLLLRVRTKLLANNVGSNTETVLEVSPEVAALLLKAKILTTESQEVMEKGLLGTFIGFKVYVSNNICTAEGENKAVYHKCLARTKRAVAFAEQVNSVEAYRPEHRFADAVKGLHLYGAKIVYPKEIVLLDLNLA